MNCKLSTKHFFLAILVLFLIFPIVSADIVTYSNYKFGLPNYGTFISFSGNQDFSNVSRQTNTWYFDNYLFSIQNSNMTITNLFSNNFLDFTTDADSIITIDASNAGYDYAPISVSASHGGMGYTWEDGVLEITGSESGTYQVNWNHQSV